MSKIFLSRHCQLFRFLRFWWVLFYYLTKNVFTCYKIDIRLEQDLIVINSNNLFFGLNILSKSDSEHWTPDCSCFVYRMKASNNDFNSFKLILLSTKWFVFLPKRFIVNLRSCLFPHSRVPVCVKIINEYWDNSEKYKQCTKIHALWIDTKKLKITIIL